MIKSKLESLAIALLAAASLAMNGEGGENREQTLRIYTWSDYFDQTVIENFEEKFNCRVHIDYFDSNEALYAKLKTGAAAYDILTPSSYMSAVLWKQGLIMELEAERIPNLVNIDRNFTSLTNDPGMVYSIPYTRTVTGVGYNTREVPPEAIGSWDIFSNSKFSKRMTMLNDMRETIGAALKFLGFSLNTVNPAEINAAARVILGWKGNLAKFDVDDSKIGLAAGEFLVTHAYNGDVALVMEENPDIGFFVPLEGSSIAADDFVIQAISPTPKLAHAFINYMLDPEVAIANMESVRYYMPNPKALERIDPELRDNPAFAVDEGIMAKCEVIWDLGEDNPAYIRAWDKIKAED
ncbi:MAG: spermidine/putrescine ABC transporter substrate-binding protein [Planctomycetota bacterium]|jgi:spermidine/putrescine transport system substrate-binding protein|nr:spermidine/putrescine ABC transporter substrate-binding protein [Planctomycetota bacterium]